MYVTLCIIIEISGFGSPWVLLKTPDSRCMKYSNFENIIIRIYIRFQTSRRYETYKRLSWDIVAKCYFCIRISSIYLYTFYPFLFSSVCASFDRLSRTIYCLLFQFFGFLYKLYHVRRDFFVFQEKFYDTIHFWIRNL